MLLSFRCGSYFILSRFCLCHVLPYFKKRNQGPSSHHIHSLRSSCFINSIQRRRKPCYGREIHVPKRISSGGALGYFLGGYVPPGTPNWHPVLKKIPLKLIPVLEMGPFLYPVLEFALKLIPCSRNRKYARPAR